MLRNITVLFILTAFLATSLSCVSTHKRRKATKSTHQPKYQAREVSKAQFIDMVRTGLPEETIEKILRKRKRGFYLKNSELLELKQLGTSNYLIWVAMYPQTKKRRVEARIHRKTKKKGETESTPENAKPENTDPKKKYPSLFYYGDGSQKEKGEVPEIKPKSNEK